MSTPICFRIMPYNYVDIDILANSAVTSEQASAGFGILNAYNKQRRTKVWRSAGYFNVTSTNNGIVFKESSGGSTFVASIATAEYTSIAAMCTAIKTAMELVANNDYTVTHVNNRFQIASNGVYFDLLCSNISFTSADLIGFATVDRTGSLTYIADNIRIHQYERITWDMGAATNPTCFALTDARNDSIKISPSAVIKLQGNETNVWTAPSYEKTLTYDDNVIAEFTALGLHTEPVRYWSLLITDRENSLGYIQVGSFYLGDFFNPTRGRPQFPLQVELIDNTETTFSEGGQSYSDVREQLAIYTINWFGLQKADIETFERDIWSIYGTGRPFWVSMDTDAAFSSISNRRILFCKFDSPPTWELMRPDNFTMSMTLREEL